MIVRCFTCLPTEERYLNLPDDLVTDSPLDMENIKEKQDADNAHSNKMLQNIPTNSCIVELAQSMMSYATLSQEILQTIGR